MRMSAANNKANIFCRRFLHELDYNLIIMVVWIFNTVFLFIDGHNSDNMVQDCY